MRVFCRHTDNPFLNKQEGSVQNGRLPTLRLDLRFVLRDTELAPVWMGIWGLVDTGAQRTAIPERYIDERRVAPRDAPWPSLDPEVIIVRDITGTKHHVAGYSARVQIDGEEIGDPIPIAAIPGLPHPIVGQDVLRQFLVTLNPWRRTTILTNSWLWRRISELLERCLARDYAST